MRGVVVVMVVCEIMRADVGSLESLLAQFQGHFLDDF